MPFGPYKDFAACVAANKDKSNPQAYCASVHKKITGKWPSEKQSLTTSERLGLLRENLKEYEPSYPVKCKDCEAIFHTGIDGKTINVCPQCGSKDWEYLRKK